MKWINVFPPKCGVSKKYMPIDILTNKLVDYKGYSKIIFGSYGRVIHETNTKNTTAPRKLGVIYLQALDTVQGGLEVFNLLTGNIISR